MNRNSFAYHFTFDDESNRSLEELDKTIKKLLRHVAAEFGWKDSGIYRAYRNPEILSSGVTRYFILAEYKTLQRGGL